LIKDKKKKSFFEDGAEGDELEEEQPEESHAGPEYMSRER
jgi:hypothetical protein